jgi:hypothetical protein
MSDALADLSEDAGLESPAAPGVPAVEAHPTPLLYCDARRRLLNSFDLR